MTTGAVSGLTLVTSQLPAVRKTGSMGPGHTASDRAGPEPRTGDPTASTLPESSHGCDGENELDADVTWLEAGGGQGNRARCRHCCFRGKTQPASCFCPPHPSTSPRKNGHRSGLEVCPDKPTMSAGKAKARGVPWSRGVTPAGTGGPSPSPRRPCPCAPTSIPGSSCLHQPSTPLTRRPRLPRWPASLPLWCRLSKAPLETRQLCGCPSPHSWGLGGHALLPAPLPTHHAKWH